jgi:hypothetical protein
MVREYLTKIFEIYPPHRDRDTGQLVVVHVGLHNLAQALQSFSRQTGFLWRSAWHFLRP